MGYSEGIWRFSVEHSCITTSRVGLVEGSKEVCSLNTNKPDDELLGNGMLLAAAPAMLTALKIVVGLLGRNPHDFIKEERLKYCLDAINKAEGTSLQLSPGLQINNFLKSIK